MNIRNAGLSVRGRQGGQTLQIGSIRLLMCVCVQYCTHGVMYVMGVRLKLSRTVALGVQRQAAGDAVRDTCPLLAASVAVVDRVSCTYDAS